MLEFAVWIILFVLLGAGTVLLRYWTDLLRRQDTYHRTELVDFATILVRQLRLFGTLPGYLAAAAGIALAWGIVLLGGLMSPDVGPEPDWAASQLPNYFLQSAATVLLFHLAWPAVRALTDAAPRPIRSFLAEDHSFFWAFSVSLAAHGLTAWGVDHQMSFLFVFLNGLALLGYAVYRLNLAANRQGDAESPDGTEGSPNGTRDPGNETTDEPSGHGGASEVPEDFSFLDAEAERPGRRRETEF